MPNQVEEVVEETTSDVTKDELVFDAGVVEETLAYDVMLRQTLQY